MNMMVREFAQINFFVIWSLLSQGSPLLSWSEPTSIRTGGFHERIISVNLNRSERD
jgi:hypothetical protein